MGRANRMLATIASGIAISFPNTHNLNKKFTRKTRITGNPVRQTVIRWSGSKYTPPGDGNPFNLLIFGGSQGARFLSDVMPLALMRLNTQTKTNMEVVQQCRIEDIERTKKSYDAAGITAHLSDFFDNMPEIIAAASLVIARAGASTITELAIIGRPSILIPLPGAIDNDQLNNAKFIENVSGGWCIQQKDATPLRIANGIKNLLADKNTLVSAAMAAHKVGYPGAAANLADFVEGCMQ
jgi:UDP-N-acetylglucosamine--N-acetylmuramyl-(pentapeptide) pyrophosphoryl-undecaprenol N-acetylglucosamine transferase